MIFWTGSSSRDWVKTGRRCSCNACSEIRAERFDDRTAANVAIASTRVPAAVASEEIVAQSVAAGTNIVPVSHARRARTKNPLRPGDWISTSANPAPWSIASSPSRV